MPTYTAKCQKCETEFEYQASILHEEAPPCIKCQSTADKIWTSPEGGFILKGGGWAKDGYSK